jgi:replication factor C large subunit
MSASWVVKHRPTDLSEFVDNEEAISALEKWLASWKTGKPSKKTAFLFGPPGIGKSESLILLARKFGFDLVEMNASDHRTRDNVQRVAGMASMESSLYGKTKIILLDELEGMSGTEDRGGLSVILSLTETTRTPLVLVATDMWDRRFTSFRRSSLFVEFKHVPTRSIIPRLRDICRKEGIEAQEEALLMIAERSRGDLRSAIIDLQALAEGKNSLTYQDVNWMESRDRQDRIFDVLKNIFNAKTCQEARRVASISDIDYEMLFEWIYENIPRQIPEIEDMAAAFNILSRADIFLNRIHKEQEWGLLPYAIEDMTGGVAMARTSVRHEWIPFKFPERIMAMSRSKVARDLRDEIGRKISRTAHTSISTAVTEYIPYLRVIFRANNKWAEQLAENLQLEPAEISFLSK